jgi:hypothetical protein
MTSDVLHGNHFNDDLKSDFSILVLILLFRR